MTITTMAVTTITTTARIITITASTAPGADIRGMLQGAPLAAAVRDHAVGIFALLAKAEAAVHGVGEDDVAFHEVGAIDSIVDIVAAAVLIARIGATRWTASPLPLGGGRVRTAHGLLPVPAPATALLLEGLPTIDDGIGGERVTPTGAAVARHLLREVAPATPQARRLVATGTGFGTRTLPGLSNCLRVLAFAEAEAASPPAHGGVVLHRELGVITFEVDDQSPEDLAHGLDHIRAMPGVHDVMHGTAFGKKGRIAMQVQVLAAPEVLQAVIAACFEETTTIGLRHQLVQGAALTRAFEAVEIDGRTLRVKTVRRPGGGVTGKAEAADVAAEPGHARRATLRRGGEAAALARAGRIARTIRRMTMMRDDTLAATERLDAVLAGLDGPLAVAVSGGIDSLTLAAVTHRWVRERATMFHAVSAAVPGDATARVERVSAAQGWTLRIIDAGEFEDADYRANPVNRCFFCKTNLYGSIARHTGAQILSGANLDDLGDYRPGLDAARNAGARHPYVEAGVDKATVRRLATLVGLADLAELPAAPCLSSRIETGIAIRPDLLKAIHAVEREIARAFPLGTVRCRVRAAGVVVELDPETLAGVTGDREAAVRALAAELFAGAADTTGLAFVPYRRGSAFLHDHH